MRVAAKILSRVEVEPEVSNQHEFNATRLWRALGYTEEPVSGLLRLLYLDRTTAWTPEGEECRYTLYDSRRGQDRSAEYRLYFASDKLQERAQVGDILVLLRREGSPNISGILAPQGSPLGGAVSTLLQVAGIPIEDRFHEINTVLSTNEFAHLLELVAEPAAVSVEAEVASLIREGALTLSIEGDKLPSTLKMAVEAQRVLLVLRPEERDPDTWLHEALEVETAIFHHLESELGTRRLEPLWSSGGISFGEALAMLGSFLQARRSRRGQSLQHHFKSLLQSEGIPFGSQCVSDTGERPDFIIPGCGQYNDDAFPSERLRMVACKSTLKERWGQILKEATRIPQKYVLTLDTGLSDEVVIRMSQSDLMVFLPQPLRLAHYSGRSIQEELGSVAQLLSLLGEACH